LNVASRRLVKPVYKRQQFLLSFIRELNEPLTATEFQKLLFLYLTKNNLPYYEFVPYLSIQAGEDINTLQAMCWLTDTNGKIQYTGGDGLVGINLSFVEIGKSIPEQLPKVRGNRLIKLVYEQYPYYAINSRTAVSIIDTEGIAKIKAVKEQFKQTGQMLFTIGYEGIIVEQCRDLFI